MLKHLAEAAAPDSRILLVEQLMTNPPSQLSAQTDFCMINIAGKERSVAMLTDIAEKAGLKAVGVHQAVGTPVGCVECVKA
jgi:hypothetical protein